MTTTRTSGLLLHPTSLPGPFGIGDLGLTAYAFADFLVSCGQSLWQVLPLGPTGYGNSPYSSYSAFAGNTLLISPQQLLTEGLIQQTSLERLPDFSDERVDFPQVLRFKDQLLLEAFENFKKKPNPLLAGAFAEFCRKSGSWLDDYALFRALKDSRDGAAWDSWEPGLARREASALLHLRESLDGEIEAQKFYQFLFFRQWLALKKYCNERGIKLIGDMPIFVAHDSADVWTNSHLFKLDERGAPTVVAGVPPDYFSATGQLWGHPIYDWQRLAADGFKWWIERVRLSLELFDFMRFDHFRGFAAVWEVPAGDQTAERGRWVEAPGRDLFTAIENALGDLPIIAENLGEITADVDTLLESLGFPGMRVLQFGFGGDSDNLHLPHTYPRNVVAFTGTHDSDTTVSWFNHISDREKEFCLQYLKSDGREINWDFIDALLASAADMIVIPLQDVLGLGGEARMNLPNTVADNWVWRYAKHDLNHESGQRLEKLARRYGRIPPRNGSS